MTHSHSRNARHVAGIVILTACLLLLGLTPTSAATLQYRTGTIGPTRFKDTSATPGATCNYEGTAGTQFFTGTTLRAIKVMFPDQNNTVEHGTVGYIVQIQYKASGGSWTTYYTSPEVKKTAYDNAWTKFPARTHNGLSSATSGKFRAQVILTWYRTNQSVKGAGYWLIDYYTRGYNGSVGSTCAARHSDVS